MTWGEIIGGIVSKMIDDFPMVVLMLILVGLCSLIWRKLREERGAAPVHDSHGDGPAPGDRQRSQENVTPTTDNSDDEDVTIAVLRQRIEQLQSAHAQ